MKDWEFYGRSHELDHLVEVLGRPRWSFVKITGRRRIGKTTLVQRAIHEAGRGKTLYIQIPDSEPAGVLTAAAEFMRTFDIALTPPQDLQQFAKTITQLVSDGYVVAIDEFQYFHRKALRDFTSFLQAEVDAISARAHQVTGALIVLGSIHTEMTSLLDDKGAPLFNRTTDQMHLGHLDIASIKELLHSHGVTNPKDLLFYWNLFEGVPKFYRDCFEQQVFGKSRKEVLKQMFFNSSSPLRHEADHWFLNEFRGRYDLALKFISHRPGCTNGDIEAHVREFGFTKDEQLSGYVRILEKTYGMIRRDQPIFSKPTQKNGRYYLQDNFLRSWLHSLNIAVASSNFKPLDTLVNEADTRLMTAEGHGLERLAAALYEERSRKALPGFALTNRMQGYWDRKDVEIDMVALNETDRIIRFGTCKRDAERLASDLPKLDKNIERFLEIFPQFRDYTIQRTAITTEHTADSRITMADAGYMAEDLNTLLIGL